MDKDLDIELIDDIDIVDDLDTEMINNNADLLKDFTNASTKEVVFSSDLDLDEVKVVEDVKPVEPVVVKETEEPVVVEDIISKTYNLADTLNQAKEEIKSTEDDGFDAKASAMYIGIIFFLLIIFVLALPYIAKLASA